MWVPLAFNHNASQSARECMKLTLITTSVYVDSEQISIYHPHKHTHTHTHTHASGASKHDERYCSATMVTKSNGWQAEVRMAQKSEDKNKRLHKWWASGLLFWLFIRSASEDAHVACNHDIHSRSKAAYIFSICLVVWWWPTYTTSCSLQRSTQETLKSWKSGRCAWGERSSLHRKQTGSKPRWVRGWLLAVLPLNQLA